MKAYARIEYKFTTKELLLLMAGLGYKSIYGFYMGETLCLDRTEALIVLYKLFQKGWIKNENNRLCIEDSLKRCLKRCGEAVKIIIVQTQDGEKLACYCSCGQITYLEPDALRKNGWNVYEDEAVTIIGELINKGILTIAVDDEIQSMQESLPAYWEAVKGGDTAKQELLRLIYRESKQDGLHVECITINSSALDHEMVIQRRTGKQVWPYSHTRLSDFLQGWLKEELS